MITTDITTIELHGSTEAYAMARLIDARMEVLPSIKTGEADLEFLVLQRLAVPLMPYILKVEQEKKRHNTHG